MPDIIQVRPCAPTELDLVGQISVKAYAAAGQLDPTSAYRAVLSDAAARHRDGILLVAEIEGHVVGTVTICPWGSSFAEMSRPDETEFRFLAVDPDHWGQGVADALIEAAEQHARNSGSSALAICVRDTNSGAESLYLKRGFHRCPERDWTITPDIHLRALTRTVPWEPVMSG